MGDVATKIAVTAASGGYVGDTVTVTLSADSGTLSATSVALQASETSTTVTLTGAAVGSVSVTASGSPAQSGGTITVTATGKPGAAATFSISGDAATDVVVDGTYDVTVTIGAGSESKTEAVVIDKTAPTIASATSDPDSLRNGESLTLKVTTEAGATVTAIFSALDTTQTDAVAVAESTTTAGTYSAAVTISAIQQL